MSGGVGPEQRRSWAEDGWCILEGAVPGEALTAAQHAVAKLFPRPDEMAGGAGPGGLEKWRTWDAAWPEFPFRNEQTGASGGRSAGGGANRGGRGSSPRLRPHLFE